jgi:hypothetical protein
MLESSGVPQTRKAGTRGATPSGSRFNAIIAITFACLLLACESREERIASLRSEIEELEERVARGANARTLLDGIEVVDSEFHGRADGREGTAQFTLTVRNNTEQMINRIQFEAVLTSPGSPEPLLQGKIDSGLPGSLEPGKRLSYVMYPMPDSAWDRLDPPVDAVLELRVVRLSALGNRNLAEARSPERQGRDESDLSSLRAELADLDASAR